MTDQFIGHFKVWEGYRKRHLPMTGPPKDPGPLFKNGGMFKTLPIPKQSTEELEDMPKEKPFKKLGQVIEQEYVNHPAYYGGEDDPYETIKVLEAKLTHEEFKGFCKGSAIKYLDRAKGKDNGVKEYQDYHKSVWYLNRMNDAIKRKESKDEKCNS